MSNQEVLPNRHVNSESYGSWLNVIEGQEKIFGTLCFLQSPIPNP